MSEFREMLVESADHLLSNWLSQTADADDRRDSAELWKALEKEGLTLVSIPEESGGAGGTLGDASSVLRLAGRHAVSVPLAETVLAGWLLSSSGLPVPVGPLAVAPVHPEERVEFHREDDGWLVSGRTTRIPVSRTTTKLVVVGRDGDKGIVALVNLDACETFPSENLAGEIRSEIVLDGIRVAGAEVGPAGGGVDEEALRLRGALARSVLMAGALEHVLELSVRYAGERQQFGRPIGKFQAIQQELATLAGEVAAASAAAGAAVQAAESSGEVADAAFEIVAAKVRVSEAAGKAAEIAHQVHGAIGFTKRHPLRHSTRRLWAWRDEFGTESEWATSLGGIIAGRGPESLWPTLTSTLPTQEREK